MEFVLEHSIIRYWFNCEIASFLPAFSPRSRPITPPKTVSKVAGRVVFHGEISYKEQIIPTVKRTTISNIDRKSLVLSNGGSSDAVGPSALGVTLLAPAALAAGLDDNAPAKPAARIDGAPGDMLGNDP
jgi:hypothetical protein